MVSWSSKGSEGREIMIRAFVDSEWPKKVSLVNSLVYLYMVVRRCLYVGFDKYLTIYIK